MSSPIIASPANMAGHVAEVLEGSYQIQDLTFEKPPVILDLGANVGSFVHWARNRWPGAVIHAYEPHPGNFELLQANCKGMAILYPCAVSDHAGSGFLMDGKHNCGESSLVDVRASEKTGVQCNVISAESLPEADIIKVDAEGSEWPILSTYAHLYGVKAIMVEWHIAEDRERIKNFLEAQGLSCIEDRRTQFYDRGLMKFQRDPKQGPGVAANSIKLLIACPCYGGLTYATHNTSVLELNNELLRNQVNFEIRYLPNESLIPRARNRFGTLTLEGDYTHLLFLDVDIGFKARDIISLIALDKDIAALPYSAKDFDWKKIVKAVKSGIEDGEVLRHIAGRPIINANKHTTFQVTEAVQFPQLGTGLLLIKRKVFEKMAQDEGFKKAQSLVEKANCCAASGDYKSAFEAMVEVRKMGKSAFTRKYKLMNNEQGDLKGDYAYEFFSIGINDKTNYFDSEDYRMCLDAAEMGFEAWLWPNAVTTHTGPYTFICDIPTQGAMGIDLTDRPKEEPVSVG